jgi:hypothetical protein
MSFDLYFCRPGGSVPAIPELKEYFAASALFQVIDSEDGGVQFTYQNEATGVYCSFSYSTLDATDSEGCASSGLSFNLNYSRPSFFAYETMPLVEAFCKRFDLVVENPQEETEESAEASRLIQSWRSHNANAMRGLRGVEKEGKLELRYLPEQQATDWWRYMSVKQGIEDELTEDMFVPSLMILQSPAQKLFTMIVWPKGIAQFFPRCDYVCVDREKKRLFGTKEEMGLVAYDSVIATIGPLLDDYEFGGLKIKYLSPGKERDAARLIQTLQLEPVELSRHTQIASDGFHDVVLFGNAPEIKTAV